MRSFVDPDLLYLQMKDLDLDFLSLMGNTCDSKPDKISGYELDEIKARSDLRKPNKSQVSGSLQQSLKTTKAKVAMDRNLTAFIPIFQKLLTVVNAPKTGVEALEAVAKKSLSDFESVDVLVEKSQVLADVAKNSDSSLDTLRQELKTIDQNVNLFFIGVFPVLATTAEGEEKLVAPCRNLIEMSRETIYLPALLLAKTEALRQQVPVVKEYHDQLLSQIYCLSEHLNTFLPFFIRHLQTVNAPPTAIAALQTTANQVPDKFYPLKTLNDQVETLLTQAEASAPSVESHNSYLKTLDAHLNQIFHESFPLYGNIDGEKEDNVIPRTALKEESKSAKYFPPLVNKKTMEILAHTSEVPEYFNSLIETKTRVTDVELQTALSEKTGLIDQLQKNVSELEKRMTILIEELADARKFNSLYKDRDEVASKLENEVEARNLKISNLTLQLDQAKTENTRLKSEFEELKKFKSKALDLELENERLQETIKSYDTALEEKKEQFETVVAKLHGWISTRRGKIDELVDRIKSLENELTFKEKERQKCLLLRVITALSNTLKVERTSTFLLWKYTSLGPEDIPPESVLDKVPETAGFKDESVDANELFSFTVTEPPLVEERKLQISTNIIAKHCRFSAIKFHSPARAIETLRFWDLLLDKKTEADQEDLAANIKPLLLSEFTLDHLLRTSNNLSIAQEQLGSHLPALYRLYADEHPYAVLISRLLHLFNASPAPLEAQVLVVEYRKQFEQLALAYSDSRFARNLPAKSDLDIASTGGEAPLRAVFTEFYDSIAAPQFIPEHWIRNLKPSNISLLDYVVFLVYLQLETQAKTPESFWTAADAGNAGKTEGDAFARAVQAIGIHISTRLFREATATPLTKEDFFAKKPTDLDDDRYLVSSAGFLTGILEAYIAKVRRATVEHTKLFESAGKPHVNKAAFTKLAHTLQADVPTEVLEKFYDEGLTLSSTQEGLDSGAFIRVLLRHFLGSYSHPPLAIEQLHLLTDLHVTEYDLETGIKTVVTPTETTKAINTRR